MVKRLWKIRPCCCCCCKIVSFLLLLILVCVLCASSSFSTLTVAFITDSTTFFLFLLQLSLMQFNFKFGGSKENFRCGRDEYESSGRHLKMRLQYLPSNERHLPDTFTIPTRITHKHVRTIISVKYLSITRLHPFITPSITSSSDAYTHSHNKSIRNTQKENHFFFLVVKLVLS